MGWYNASWGYRVKVTVLATKVDADLTGYPVYVDLNDLPAGFHTNVNQTDARDIRVTTSDETTEVPREVVWYNSTSDTGEMYFKGDVDSDTDTDFYIYYGNAAATEPAVDATYGRNNTWTSYISVYHFQGTPTGSAGDITDSAGTNHGTSTGMGAGNLTTKIGNAYTFSGTSNDDFINLGNGASLNPDSVDQMSFEAWANLDEQQLWGQIISDWKQSENSSYQFGFNYPNDNIEITLFNGTGSPVHYKGDTNLTSYGTWYHLAGVVDTSANTIIVYKNGASDHSYTGVSENFYSTGGNTIIGARSDGVYDNFNGILDEIRISGTAFAGTWVSTNYNNQSDPGSFYTVGTQEEGSTALSINVYDEVTVTDIVGYEDETVTVTDTVVNVTLTTPPEPPLSINVYDEAFASDVVIDIVIKPLKISVYDQPNVTDVIVDIVIKPLKINVFDESAVTDVMVDTTIKPKQINVFDSAIVSELEPPTVVITTPSPTGYEIDVFDTSTVTDVVIDLVVKPLKITIFDTAIATDVVVDILIKPLKINVFDTPTASDVLVDLVIKPLKINVYEESAVTDAVLEAKIPSCPISVYEDITVTDAIVDVVINPLKINVYDESQVTDEVTVFIPKYVISVYDEAIATDEGSAFVNAIGSLYINVYDEAIATDSATLFQPSLKIVVYDTTFDEKAYQFILVDGDLALHLSGIFFIKL